VWIAWQIPLVAREQGLHAVITPNTKFPFGSVPRFTMVHGLEWLHCPRSYRATEWLKQCTWLVLASYFSSGLITFTRATYRDICRIRSIEEDSVCIVPEGINPTLRRLAPEERSITTLERLGVTQPFVLSVCSLEPRKNLDRMIRAFSRLVEDGKLPHQLVLVGRAGWKSSKLAALTEQLGLTCRVRLTGYVSDEDLLHLYNQADLFVYPSLYEGFGLPLLEAMVCGVPIVSSRAGSLAEVAGEAAILVDPHSAEEIATGMSQGLADEALRGRLVEAGLDRVHGFSWDEMARGICEFVDNRLRADR
jgi:glycosyltransferase involved in cell wall biosynthesis